MNSDIHLLDVVALTEATETLRRGQVGTVVEVLAPDAFEVEFSDNNGRTYALVPLPASKLMVLHHQPVSTSS